MTNDRTQASHSTPANNFPTESFDDPVAAVARVSAIYEANTSFLRDAFARYRKNEPFSHRVRACYPFVRVRTELNTQIDSRRSYGFVAGPGIFETTLTLPDLFGHYYREQLRLLTKNHHVGIEVGVSAQPVPIHFAFAEGIHLEGDLDRDRLLAMRNIFDMPDLALLDDRIVNGTYEPALGEPHPLALFTAARVDFSLHRLKHYTATSPTHFQNYVLYTNYQFYIDEFVKLGRRIMSSANDEETRAYRSEYTSFIEPGDVITGNENLGDSQEEQQGVAPARLPQMPAYHLKRANGSGITMVNIGVGPSNAKTITDHIAVLRPHAWIMLGHCAGLRNTQRLGDYVLAHGYVRKDHVLDACRYGFRFPHWLRFRSRSRKRSRKLRSSKAWI
ncbi:AMP nucleosidase [Candidatus Burkholderia crenata]|nr:AMP nucleosidase [Candidatus Burkholderia crenata]